jgi:hypothetical protein
MDGCFCALLHTYVIAPCLYFAQFLILTHNNNDTHTHSHTALEKLLGFSLEKCLMKVWPNTDLFCGGSHGIPNEELLRVKRPYGRVDRVVSGKEISSERGKEREQEG